MNTWPLPVWLIVQTNWKLGIDPFVCGVATSQEEAERRVQRKRDLAFYDQAADGVGYQAIATTLKVERP